MDDITTFCFFGLFLLIVVGLSWFLRRNRPKPQGTYDDPNTRSGGSIGGEQGRPGQRTYDDPDTRSGGSLGGNRGETSPAQRTYDDPDTRSGGSFGGSGGTRSQERSTRPTSNRAADAPRAPAPPSASPGQGQERPRHDDPDTRSGGSFGG